MNRRLVYDLCSYFDDIRVTLQCEIPQCEMATKERVECTSVRLARDYGSVAPP